MARNFRPDAPFNVAMRLLIPTETYVKGSVKKVFPEPDDSPLIFGSFRTFGGSESIENDVYTVVSTGVVDTWYRPDIKPNCRIYLLDSDETYEIVNDPEDIEKRHQYLQFKVRKVAANA